MNCDKSFFNDGYHPLNLKCLTSSLFDNITENNFDSFDFFNLKVPSLDIKPIFYDYQVAPKTTYEVDIAEKPVFLSSIISTAGVKKFSLLEKTKCLDETDSYIESASLKIDIKSNKKIKTPNNNIYDEQFVRKHTQMDNMKPFIELIPNPARKWPFEPDIFQKQAIMALEDKKSVFVAAHTSAGKTVVAEYAIAMCQRIGARVIYTSPIKALSNQKYREFKLTFGNDNVGLLTGDIKTGTQKYILVMTTEILHNMLKNDCPTLKDLEVVIMDEVHYLNDQSRGHIWEQIMILLPKRIQLVMLSATVPNTTKFGEWLGRIRNTQIQVISTLTRPVPLAIFLYLGTGRSSINDMYMLTKNNSPFKLSEYNKAVEEKRMKLEKFNQKSKRQQFTSTKELQNPESQQQQQQQQQKYKHQMKGATNNKGSKTEGLERGSKMNEKGKDYNQWISLFEMLKINSNLPVIIFMFSRKRIESTVNDFTSLNFLTKVEETSVYRYFSDVIKRKLPSRKDRCLSQVVQLQLLLVRGIGVHHAGLLPILKEIVEVLFTQGFVKILFATETFAVGVNMPAKSVVFDSLWKHDGTSRRMLLSGEFIQMAGRAGRRGLDEIGNVIILIKGEDQVTPMGDLRKLIEGEASNLESRFKISYNMILSLYRNRQFNIQYMIRHSFIEADRLKKYDDNCNQLDETREELKVLNLKGLQCTDNECNADMVYSYYQDCLTYKHCHDTVIKAIESASDKVLSGSLLCPGRLLIIEPKYANMGATKRLLFPALILQITKPLDGSDKWSIKVLTFDVELNRIVNKPLTKFDKVPVFTEAPPIVRPGHDQVQLKRMCEVLPLVINIKLSEIFRICQYKVPPNMVEINGITKHWQTKYFLNFNQADFSTYYDWAVKSPQFFNALLEITNNLVDDNKDKLNSINFEKELNIKDAEMKNMFNRYLQLDSVEHSAIAQFDCIDCTLICEHIDYMHRQAQMVDKCDTLERELSDDNLAFLPDYRTKVELLKVMEFIHAERDVINLKGRIACEIESYEVVMTEMLLSGVFNEAEPWDVTAALSCLVFENRSPVDSEFRLADCSVGLRKILDTLFEIVDTLNMTQQKLGTIGADSVELNCGLVLCIKAWTEGHQSFSDCVEMTEAQCGDIIRCIQRLSELMRHCEAAAKVIPNFFLSAKFKRIQELLFRGVVSTPSLYVDE